MNAGAFCFSLVCRTNSHLSLEKKREGIHKQRSARRH
jgi:hypothetical protein